MTVRLVVNDDDLDLQITGWFDTTMCLSSGMRIPLADVTGAHVASWDEVTADLGWRLGGAYWPGLIATGWYGVPERKGARQFLAVFRDRDELLVVDTRLERPTRLVLGLEDRDRLAWWINERVGGAVS